MAKLACKMVTHELIGGWWCIKTQKNHDDSKDPGRKSMMTEDFPTLGLSLVVCSEAVLGRGQEMRKTSGYIVWSDGE